MIRDKFSSENPYVLPIVALTARSTVQGGLQVILQEQDYLNSTNAVLRTEAVTNNAANPVSAVTSVAQQTLETALVEGQVPGYEGWTGGSVFISIPPIA
jgi:hypothetical protein